MKRKKNKIKKRRKRKKNDKRKTATPKPVRVHKVPFSSYATSFVKASRDTKLIDFIGFRTDVRHAFSNQCLGSFSSRLIK